MSRNKKILITFGVLLVVAVIAFLVYYFFFRSVTPIPDGGDFPPPGDEITPEDKPPVVLPPETTGAFEPILRQLSKVPIAGSVLGTKGGKAIVRYQDRATGNIFEIGAEGEGEKRLTNTTIPKVYEALWSKSGTALISRYVREDSETIESFSARVSPGVSGAEGELKGTFLPRDILDGAISPDGTSFFYLTEDRGGVTGVRSDLTGSARTQIWTSPVREWLVSWPAQNKIFLLSKPTALADGLLLSLDPQGGGSALILRNIQGLTALPNPTRPEILYSSSGESEISLSLFNSATGDRTPAGVTTLPEKCAWNKGGDAFYCGVPKTFPPGSYPDAWYQGVIPFEDEVWSVTSSGETKRILDISDKRGLPIDLTNPEISPDDKFLIFTDKVSGTLWSLQMKE
ncbi:MAG: hypothetical protein Q7R64_00865 [bacterium]|nr:hypothetical protein [bacterium]